MDLDSTHELRERMNREIERVQGSLRELDRDRRNAKHVLWLSLLALPAAVFVNPPAALIVIVFTVSLFAVALYLISVHRREYLGIIADCRRDIARAEAGAARRGRR